MDSSPGLAMSSQMLNYAAPAMPAYSFLSKPPQKKRPAYPPPATPNALKHSAGFTAIASWAATVQPGSPGSPHSIRRRSSLSRRPSHSSRCTPSPRSASHSFILVSTPSPAAKDFAIDLTDLGYTSVFVHLPKTPSTPAHLVAMKTPVDPAPPVPSTSASPPLKRFRSFGILRSRSRLPPSPTKSVRAPRSPTKSDAPKRKKASAAHTVTKPKAAKPKPKPELPPSLAAEIALMQFADGGSTEENIRRLMASHARAAAQPAAVADVYRDGRGGIWRDPEEEMEYVHLLPSQTQAGEKWVSFGGEVRDGKHEEDEDESLAIAGLARRDSATSNTSSLDPHNVVKPAEEDAALVRVPVCVPAAAPRSAAKEKRRAKPKPEPLLTVPSRPRTQHHHLRASPNFFLLDLDAFRVPATPSSASLRTPKIPKTPRTPRTPGAPYPMPTTTRPSACAITSTTTSANTSPSTSPSTSSNTPKRARGPARRRPAPLTIAAHVPMRGVSPELSPALLPVPTPAPASNDAEMHMYVQGDARTEFLAASFAPLPPRVQPTAPLRVRKRSAEVVRPAAGPGAVEGTEVCTLKKKGSRPLLGLGIFGRK
ncbi:hypothetical protein H0H81_012175 [Sphagnurus paluster]|uniref:Uncharacterized protein n=1 Tax=Sphagnurus paluster TaxID=117069 RepID=A0A9P7FRX7_9AGAR|nr:hypothetical protein H0H81_012175 [Sphagnurus paluster]